MDAVSRSDFTSMLAETEADESSAAAAYEKLTKENTVAAMLTGSLPQLRKTTSVDIAACLYLGTNCFFDLV